MVFLSEGSWTSFVKRNGHYFCKKTSAQESGGHFSQGINLCMAVLLGANSRHSLAAVSIGRGVLSIRFWEGGVETWSPSRVPGKGGRQDVPGPAAERFPIQILSICRFFVGFCRFV